MTLLYEQYPQQDIINQEYIKGLARFLQGQSAAQIDDVCSCVFRPPFTQVIKSCWKVSGFILRAVWDRINQHHSAHAFLNENIVSLLLWSAHIFSPALSVSQTFTRICVCLSLCACVSPHTSVLLFSSPYSFSHYLFYFHSLFLHYTSFFPAPTTTPLFHSPRKSHSLIWDMLDLVSLKATLLTPCLPLLRTAQGI